jgi:hypothetical protein
VRNRAIAPFLERRAALALVLRNTKAGIVFNERIA